MAIAPASGLVGPGVGLLIGILSGIICFWGGTWPKKKIGYDDALDVFAMHGLGGISGALMTGIFAAEAIGGTPGVIEGNFF